MSGILSASVGRNGVNKSKDVGTVQGLINVHYKKNQAYRAKIKEKLVIDKDCGPSTIGAIEAFQSTVLKWNNTDGRVDVKGKATTWRALNGNVQGSVHIVKKRTNGQYVVHSQLKYKKTLTGNSTASSISRTGCTLTVLTMAATAIGGRNKKWPSDLLPKDLNPVKANEILKSSGAFVGGDMIISKGANALGMKFEEYGRSSVLSAGDISLIVSHLSKGYPVAAHVDYKRGSAGDHWILIVRQNSDGTFSAIDPLFGGEIILNRSSANNARAESKAASKKKGVLFGEKGNQDKKAGPKTQKGQQNYIVVRFGLLSPLSLGAGPGVCLSEEYKKSSEVFSGFSLTTHTSKNAFDIF
ncbi:hypothetical protein MNBD_GAMMA11-1813 [hydrothermal vent metagenome]|uniref:Peptidase C39-like domain-containing protein n=1 Tax=hydrothermal vent metagenome TaxID=652676 RepID=A0A3B0XA28_9ZZZZ